MLCYFHKIKDSKRIIIIIRFKSIRKNEKKEMKEMKRGINNKKSKSISDYEINSISIPLNVIV